MADEFPMSPVSGSSAIASHGYDQNSRKMRVQFKGSNGKPGHTYELEDVPPERYAGLTGAASPGSYYSKKIAPLHQGRKVK